MTSNASDGVEESPPAKRGEYRAGSSTGVTGSGEEAALGSDGSRVSDNVDDSRVLMVESEVNARGDGGNQVSYSTSGMVENPKSTDLQSEKQEQNDVRTATASHTSILSDYNSFLSAFDEFASEAKGEAVGHGYYIGDMVWGKVKSHPWWPGQIYNEALVSPSVRRSKHEGQILVAFFGDNSYGWFDPAELIPFEENFAEKSKQSASRALLSAVEDGVEEVTRRRSLGLACYCRNECNFQPSRVEGYFVVDLGDSESGVYSWSQINKARDSFQPREMLSFVEQLALQPMNHQFLEINFIKNKATALACRRARYEEFDETYDQAFGSALVRPPGRTVPTAADPSKAPLSGPLVIAEALGQGKLAAKPAKTKGQVETEKYLIKRRGEPMQMKRDSAVFGIVSASPHLLSVDSYGFSGNVMHLSPRDHINQSSGFTITYNHPQPKTHQVSITSDIKHSEGFNRQAEGGKKEIKVLKRPAGELNAEGASRVEGKKKKRQEIKSETIGKFKDLPLNVNNSATPVDNKLENKKIDSPGASFPSQSQQKADFAKLELQMMVTDLRALALNPFHGTEMSCPAVIRQVFKKYRSLVYQKSLVSSPPPQQGPSERNTVKSLADKTTDKKIGKPLVRHDDPSRSTKKRGPFDPPNNTAKKKKLDAMEEIKKKKKIDDSSSGTTKKRMDESKPVATERKILQKPSVLQRVETKENASKIAAAAVPPKLARPESGAKNSTAVRPKSLKVHSSSRMELGAARVPIPTMLLMKFPADAPLPSGAELRAKFARFGPMDHSATRVFWKTHMCRVVFSYKIDAEAALKFALGSSNLFGNTNVKCYIKVREAEAAEIEPSKIQDDTAAAVGVTSAQAAAAAHLKSCLKKPSGEDDSNGNGRGRVKFVLGGDDGSARGESKIKKMSTQPPAGALPLRRPPLPPPEREREGVEDDGDVSRQMVRLLLKCNDVVRNLSSLLGYMPYQPL
ncbi:PWWP domain-containing protein 1-like [Andrographis paniculata]|uniref:PWWP domain-containing protein 1-like n=1 Tax=Andrographis paniculata TaxID=175694 RepID=UPI0021E71CC1|nr:PWWP domain-containing protein 1-like [Andrographis paniculata]